MAFAESYSVQVSSVVGVVQGFEKSSSGLLLLWRRSQLQQLIWLA